MRSSAHWLAAAACVNLAVGALPAPATARAIPFCGTPPPGGVPPENHEPQRRPVPGGPCHVLLCNADRERRNGSG